MDEILRMISPGSPLRNGLDNVLMANTGGLIVVAENDQIFSLVDGGFELNADYTPSSLYELAKMDGAIVLDKNIEKSCLQTPSSCQILIYLQKKQVLGIGRLKE